MDKTDKPTGIVAVDGRDALFVLIVRPSKITEGAVSTEMHGDGLGPEQVVAVLRQLADKIAASVAPGQGYGAS